MEFEMNKNIMRQCGFSKEVELVEKGYCPFCKRKVNVTEFKNAISKKEFKISGLCNTCQNETFKKK
jgi:hypothetical protein